MLPKFPRRKCKLIRTFQYVAAPKFGIAISDWREMMKAILDSGYNVSMISKETGIPRNTIWRWVHGTEEVPGRRVFCQILYLYCYVRCKSRS